MEEAALREFEQARLAILKCHTMNKGGAKAEKCYSDAYQKLVSLGLRPQIRKKYRSPN